MMKRSLFVGWNSTHTSMLHKHPWNILRFWRCFPKFCKSICSPNYNCWCAFCRSPIPDVCIVRPSISAPTWKFVTVEIHLHHAKCHIWCYILNKFCIKTSKLVVQYFNLKPLLPPTPGMSGIIGFLDSKLPNLSVLGLAALAIPILLALKCS